MPDLNTLGDKLHWSYANLAMAHAAVSNGQERYGQTHYMIRTKLFKGLRSGPMTLGSFLDDERLKLVLPQACCYCGARDHLSMDHVVSKKLGGMDQGENLVWACRSCNSSKGAKDLLVWLASQGVEYLPILLLRRYLKLVIRWSQNNELIECTLANAVEQALQFAMESIPSTPPEPVHLKLWMSSLDDPIGPNERADARKS